MHTTLITVEQLQALQRSHTPVRLFDCSFDLMQPQAGRAQFSEQHIAGALYADLGQHLSAHDAADAVNGGRHPLPRREVFAQWLGQCGVDAHTQVVVYDRQGVNYCGRLWWMLKWCGHEAVAVLDGGLQAWVAAGYRGDVEPLDPVAGHIPGALNRPFGANLDARGFFKSPDQLRQEFLALLDGRDAASVVHHCGSGVSAVPNLLAMEVAGLGRAALYAGSWSEWCNTPGLPVAKG